MAPAYGAQFIAPQLAENGWQPIPHLIRKLPNETLAAAGDLVHLASEQAAEIQ